MPGIFNHFAYCLVVTGTSRSDWFFLAITRNDWCHRLTVTLVPIKSKESTGHTKKHFMTSRVTYVTNGMQHFMKCCIKDICHQWHGTFCEVLYQRHVTNGMERFVKCCIKDMSPMAWNVSWSAVSNAGCPSTFHPTRDFSFLLAYNLLISLTENIN